MKYNIGDIIKFNDKSRIELIGHRAIITDCSLYGYDVKVLEGLFKDRTFKCCLGGNFILTKEMNRNKANKEFDK